MRLNTMLGSFRDSVDDFLRYGKVPPRLVLQYRADACGHQTRRRGKVTAFGKTIQTKMPLNEQGSVDYCLDCLAKMAVRCVRCGHPIFIGSPITLYTPTAQFDIPEHVGVHSREPLELVGCIAWNCCDTVADRAGYWIPGPGGKGQVLRLTTAYEDILNNNTSAWRWLRIHSA